MRGENRENETGPIRKGERDRVSTLFECARALYEFRECVNSFRGSHQLGEGEGGAEIAQEKAGIVEKCAVL